MKIKKGDKVIVTAGKDKGTTGVVSRSFPASDQVIIDGVNIKKQHQKERGKNKGGIIDMAHPIHVSNVMLVDPKENKPTRIGKVFDEKKQKLVRVAKKSGTTLV